MSRALAIFRAFLRVISLILTPSSKSSITVLISVDFSSVTFGVTATDDNPDGNGESVTV